MLRYYRERKGWTQWKTALQLNINVVSYQKWEWGKDTPTIPRIRDISDVLEIDYIELLLHYEIITYEDLHTIRRVKDEH